MRKRKPKKQHNHVDKDQQMKFLILIVGAMFLSSVFLMFQSHFEDRTRNNFFKAFCHKLGYDGYERKQGRNQIRCHSFNEYGVSINQSDWFYYEPEVINDTFRKEQVKKYLIYLEETNQTE